MLAGHAGHRRDHVGAGFGLPPGVDDRAALLADHGVVPHPGFGVDGLADGAEQADAGQVVAVREFVAELHQCAQCGRRGVENRDPVVLADFPEAAGVGVHRPAFVDHRGAAGRQRTVGDVGVAGDPADVRGAPEDVVVAQVEHPQVCDHGVQQVAGAGMLDALGFAGGAGGVQQEQRVVGADPFGFAYAGLALGDVVPPVVAAVLHRHVVTGAFEYDHVVDAVAAVIHRLVDVLFQRDDLAGAVAAVSGDDDRGAGVIDAVTQGFGREAAEHDRVDRADAGAGLHRDHGLNRHRQIDDHAVAVADAHFFQAVGEAAHFVVQLLVADVGGLTLFAFENNRGLVGLVREVTVDAVIRHVHLAVAEPAEKRRAAVVQHRRERFVPVEMFAGQFCPETVVVFLGPLVQGFEVRGFDACLRGEVGGWIETASFGQGGADVGIGHGIFSLTVILYILATAYTARLSARKACTESKSDLFCDGGIATRLSNGSCAVAVSSGCPSDRSPSATRWRLFRSRVPVPAAGQEKPAPGRVPLQAA